MYSTKINRIPSEPQNTITIRDPLQLLKKNSQQNIKNLQRRDIAV